MATVPGIDVSYWNSGIDWPKVRATGQRFMIAKATEGDSYQDPTLDDNWLGAKSAGLLRGAYHFFHCNLDPKKQANNYINYVRSMKDNGEIPPVLDLETHDNVKKEKIIPAVKTWLDLVEAAFGKKPIIYSSFYFLQDYFSEAGGGPPSWAKDYPLWLAQYPNQYVDGMSPSLPRGWFKWTIWQYSKVGKVNGVNANVDMDLFNGSLDDLYKFTGAKEIHDTPQAPRKHVIAAGDSFESIANKYGITLRELLNANPQLLKSGDALTIPAAVSSPVDNTNTSGGTAPAPKSYTVKPGNSLYTIAIMYGTTVAALASFNNISDPNHIDIGQVLKIP